MPILRTLSTKASLVFNADRFFKTTASYISKSFAVGIGEFAPNINSKERDIFGIKSWLKQWTLIFACNHFMHLKMGDFLSISAESSTRQFDGPVVL